MGHLSENGRCFSFIVCGKDDGNEVVWEAVSGEGCSLQQYGWQRVWIFYGEYGCREEGECKECHADDGGLLLCEDSGRGCSWVAAAVLPVYGGWREGEGRKSSALFSGA